jgi:hypothetical protein
MIRPMSETAAGPTLLYCRCAYAQVVPSTVKGEVLEGLAQSGVSFESVSDLCEMAAHRDDRFKALAGCSSLRIAACYPRAVRGLFQQAGAALPEDAEVLNMRTASASEIVQAMLRPQAGTGH